MDGFNLSDFVRHSSNKLGVDLEEEQVDVIVTSLIQGKAYPKFITDTEDMIFDTVGVKVER